MTIAGTQTCARCATREHPFEQLQAQVAQLQAELAAAKKTSANSSKPPSSDIVKKPQPKNASKRKRGGQPGHDKHERPAFDVEQVDECIEYHCSECPDCHGPVVPSKVPPKVIQQVNLLEPAELMRVVEFRSQACWCRKCKQVHYAPIDEAIHDRDRYTPQDFQTELQQAGNKVRTAAMGCVPDTKEAENLSQRFRKHGDSYLRFITTPGIEPTNNLAEQAIRFVVIDRKVTQGTRSETGQRWLERIWTVMATCAQSGRSVLTFLHESLTASCADEPPPSLLPDGT